MTNLHHPWIIKAHNEHKLTERVGALCFGLHVAKHFENETAASLHRKVDAQSITIIPA